MLRTVVAAVRVAAFSALTAVLLAANPSPLTAQVSVYISPTSGTFTDPALSVVINWCSNSAPLQSWSRSIILNGQDVTNQFDYIDDVNPYGCSYPGQSSGTITLQPGSNTLTASISNNNSEYGEAAVTYTLQTSGGGSTTCGAQTSTLAIAYADCYREVSRCVADCFSATATYATPAYVSLDVPRGLTLVYRSDRASPVGLVEIDATDASPGSVQKYSLLLRRPDNSFVTFRGGLQEVFFAGGATVTRLAAQFGVPGMTTGAYSYTAVVRTHYHGGGTAEATIPARVMIVDGSSSPFGAGWDIAERQYAVVQSDGVMVVSGDGSASFFTGCSGTCQLVSPQGDFSTLRREGDGSYVRTYPDGTRLFFTAAGHLFNVWDRFGYGPAFGNDGSGKPLGITDPVGYGIAIGYDGNGKLSYITTPGLNGASRTSNFTVDGAGDLVWARDPDLVVNFTASYSAHRLTSLTDRRGGQWSYAYGADLRVETVTAPLIAVSGGSAYPQTLFAGPSREILARLANGAQGQSWNPVSAGLDLRASVRNPRTYTTYFALNRWGAPTQVDHPVGPSATAQYNAAGQVTQTVSSSGHTVNYSWNGVQLTQVQDVTTGRTVNMTYESTFNRPTSISGSTVSRTFSYPSLYRIDVQTGSHPATVITLDTYGRQSVVTDPGGHQTRFFYTNSGLKNTDSVKAVGRTWYRYDTFGRMVAVVHPNNTRDSVMYDALNRTTASTNGLNQTTTFSYADNVFLTHVTDALGQQYQFVRNALGWVEQEYRPGSGTPIQAVYDVNGNVTSATNRRSQAISYGYDALDRVTQSSSAAGTTTWSYLSATPSSQGYVAAVTAESSDTLFYDATDRLVRAATGRPGGAWYSLAYSYNSLGMVSGVSATSNRWSGAKSTGYGYNATGALAGVNGVALNPAAGNEDLATQITYPNGLALSRSFGGLHQSFTATWSSGSVQPWLGHQTQLNPMSRIESITDADSKGRIFTYDAAHRLARHENWTMSGSSCSGTELTGCTWWDAQFQSATDFTYDAAGNLLNDVTQLDIPGNRVRAARGYAYNWDADGNLASKVGNGLTQTFGFDALGQLTSANTNGQTSEYAYDAFGRRVRKTVGGTTTRYLHDGDNLYIELDANGYPVAEYAYFGLDRPVTVTKGGQTYYFARDAAVGSVSGLIRESDNQVVSTMAYTPYGEFIGESDGVGVPFRFAGREYDQETGLYYNRARYYDPVIGRFISEDPIGVEGGVNLYVYAANDPVNLADPDGLEPECPKDKALKDCPQELPPNNVTAPRGGGWTWSSVPGHRGGTWYTPAGGGGGKCGFACGKGAASPPPPFRPFVYDNECRASLAALAIAVTTDLMSARTARQGINARTRGEEVFRAGRLGQTGGSTALGQASIDAGKLAQRVALQERFAAGWIGSPPNSIFGMIPIVPGALTLDAAIGVATGCGS